ncbi:MAG TPA: PEP-CTERM sorting domain-containing protein [Candidatus Sulfopaludibacter sp.]|nr:PEP-CTERM sorting domain-containing protein [Candidatus Sulfopaludibacter sp.]
MGEANYFLVAQFFVGVLFCASVFGQPYTSGTVSGSAFAGNYSQSNPSHASGFTDGDFSTGFSVWDSSAQANSMFGFNGAYAEASYAYAVGYGDPSFGDNPGGSASYSLSWSTADNSQSGTIISVEAGLGDSVNGLYTGTFSFVYGTPYNIEGLLGVNVSYPYATATATSIWDDTITFLGQPDGTAGNATFTISLTGSYTMVPSQYVGPSAAGLVSFDKDELVGDFTGGAVLSNIELPENASILAASGTIYPVPEPGTFGLLGLGLIYAGLQRFKLKVLTAVQGTFRPFQSACSYGRGHDMQPLPKQAGIEVWICRSRSIRHIALTEA